MRVTELTKHNAVYKNLNRTSGELQNLMVEISNGKELNKPSDDPIGAAKVQDFQTSINHAKVLEKNIGADKVWLNTTEEIIRQIADTLMHVKELALEGSNGASTSEYREGLASEMKLITKDLLDIGNKKEGKLYLLSGTDTFTKPLEMRSSIVESELDFHGTRIKSAEKVIPLLHDQPFPGIIPGFFTIKFADVQAAEAGAETDDAAALLDSETVAEADESINFIDLQDLTDAFEEGVEAVSEVLEEGILPDQIVIFLTGTESIREIVEKINQAAIAEQKYVEDPHSPVGFKARVTAEIGTDNAIYLDPAAGTNVQFGFDTTGFSESLKFGVVGDPEVTSSDETLIKPLEVDPKEYEAEFEGYAKEKYLVRVIKGGTYGIAHYIVSDDDGQTWSQPILLQRQNEIFNPEGLASNKVKLNFRAPGQPFFREGIEFKFNGNEYIEYHGNEQIKEVIIDNGIKVALNVNAKQLFFEDPDHTDTVNIFDVLKRLKEALEDDDQMSVMKSLDDVNKALDQVLTWRSEIGSTFKELESSEERIEKSIDFKSEELSKIADKDMAKGAIDLNSAELKHQVALDSAARLVQPTLINFLK